MFRSCLKGASGLVLCALLAAPSLAEGPIKIGVPVGLSGANSVVAPSVVQSAELAVEEINKAGGVLGLVAGESLKSILTWATMKPRPPMRAVWSGIGHYVGFSRWIWASSVINLLLNQFDKVVVGKLLGPAQLGGYQMSSRLAQMLLADAAIAMVEYAEFYTKAVITGRTSALG